MKYDLENWAQISWENFNADTLMNGIDVSIGDFQQLENWVKSTAKYRDRKKFQINIKLS